MHSPPTTHKKRTRHGVDDSLSVLSNKSKRKKSNPAVSDYADDGSQSESEDRLSLHHGDASAVQQHANDSRTTSTSKQSTPPFAPCFPRPSSAEDSGSESDTDDQTTNKPVKTELSRGPATLSVTTRPQATSADASDEEANAGISSSSKPARRKTTRKTKLVEDLSLPIVLPDGIKPEHVDLLSNRWLSAVKLNEMARDEGLVYKKGKFSPAEEKLITAAIENYRTERQLTADEIANIVHPPERRSQKDNDFWFRIASAVPGRPVISVYHYLRRAMHESRGMGRWEPNEDARLEAAIKSWGQRWEKVSAEVGRSASDCRDRYRNHLVGKGVRKQGTWSKQEEQELERIVMAMKAKMGKKSEDDIFWTRVAEQMGQTRNRQQCQQKWVNQLAPAHSNKGERRSWTNMDSYILFHKIDALNVHDDTEIDWAILSDEDWDYWSPAILSRRWARLKKLIQGVDGLTRTDMMNQLRDRWETLPKERKKRKKTLQPISADIVESHSENEG